MSTAITTRHPIPGANVIDHLHFALQLGGDLAQNILVAAINQVIQALGVSTTEVVRLAVCGNPAQLSLFQGGEFRDLTYAGRRKLDLLGVRTPERAAAIVTADAIPGLALPANCEVINPPAVCQEVGADSLALILQSGMLERDEVSIAIDFGTNAEMALLHERKVYTGSAAAGSAIEGQQLSCGTLAVPGAICDLLPSSSRYRTMVLSSEMLPTPGMLVDLSEATDDAGYRGPLPIGITGTGVIAAIHEAIAAGMIERPHIRTRDAKLHLGSAIELSEHDVLEAGKAFGALRAGQIALCKEAGIRMQDIQTAYLAGASGTYMDAVKAMSLGLIPPQVKTVRHLGNTSLATARDLVKNPSLLATMTELANQLKKTFCMLAQSHTFKSVYILEYSYWTEGMPMSEYRAFLASYGLPELQPMNAPPTVVGSIQRVIDDMGPMGLQTILDIGRTVELQFDGCIGCARCEKECPTKAISMLSDAAPTTLLLKEALCDGIACRRCERVCPADVLAFEDLFRPAEPCITGRSPL